jgi:SAM-dependent methyltransferase
LFSNLLRYWHRAGCTEIVREPMIRTKPNNFLESILLPVMVCSPDRVLERMGLPSLRSARYGRTARFIGARHLDLGCGNNPLQDYRPDARVIGLDVQVTRPKFDPSVVGVAEYLPFVDGSFDSLSMVACLNHFGERDAVIREACRVVRPGGRIIVTMIGPLVGVVCHKWRFWYQDTLYREVHPGEVDGMGRKWVRALFSAHHMPCVYESAFLARMNRIFVFERPADGAALGAGEVDPHSSDALAMA